MTEKRQTAAFGIIDPEGDLLPMTGENPDALFVLVGHLTGIHVSKVKDNLTKAGWRSVPVMIVEVV